MLSDMLAPGRLGYREAAQDYADDVSIVNGSGAPILGWTNYLAVYQEQRARMKQVRMDRSNTYIKVSERWRGVLPVDFAGVVMASRVHRRAHDSVLEKRSNRWVIVHNHTSLASARHQQLLREACGSSCKTSGALTLRGSGLPEN